MFYYYQIRNHHYKTEPVPQVSCPLCGANGNMHMSILQKYTWMIGPMAPSAKYAIAWCQNCGQYIPKVKWTDEMDAAYVGLKQGLQTPARLYRGVWVLPLILVVFISVLLFTLNFNTSRQKNKQEFVKEATSHPQRGDIFQVNHSMGTNLGYTYFKVNRVTNDSLYVQQSNVRHTDMQQWDEIPTEKTAYEGDELGFSLSKMAQMDMFTWGQDDKEYGLIWGVWRGGKLYKKY